MSFDDYFLMLSSLNFLCLFKNINIYLKLMSSKIHAVIINFYFSKDMLINIGLPIIVVGPSAHSSIMDSSYR